MLGRVEMNNSNINDVLAIGNAIVDIIAKVDYEFLEQNNLVSGSMTLINEEKAIELQDSLNAISYYPGGSAANTLAGFAKLGGKCKFVGKTGVDDLASVFKKHVINNGISFADVPSVKNLPTARCVVMVTPDAQRTMCTFLGASNMLTKEDLNYNDIMLSKIIYLEGYLFDLPACKDAFLYSVNVAKKLNKIISLSLSDSFCVERHRNSFMELLKNGIDILFTNSSEIMSLFETDDFNKITNQISKYAKIGVITKGSEGADIISLGKKEHIPSLETKLVDTTGAGDLFASGFLAAYTKNQPLKTCGILGSVCASKVISHFGAQPQDDLLDFVRSFGFAEDLSYKVE